MRGRRRISTYAKCPESKQLNTLTGIGSCWHCGGRIHSQIIYTREPRLGCYNRQQRRNCPQRSASLSVYEHQLEKHLNVFHIPDDYQERLLEAHWKLEAAYVDVQEERTNLESRLKRVKRMF